MSDGRVYYSANPESQSTQLTGPLYYGRPTSYGSPAYYGVSAYGSHGYGNYGGYGYGAYGYGRYGGISDEEGGMIFGSLTLSRILRVVSKRWLSLFVFLVIGLVVAFAVYRISPTIYEAKSEFTMDMRRSSGVVRGANGMIADVTPDYGNTYAEIFNTRISEWRSSKLVARIVQRYRTSHLASVATDEELYAALATAVLELQRNSRIITISVRSQSASLCAALANAYAETIEDFTDEENRLRCDKAVSQIHANVEKQRHNVDRIAKQIVDFRTANKVDNLRSTRDMIQQGLSKTTTDILTLEANETQLVEWEKMLSAVQKDPASYGSLSTGVPRAQEIAAEFRSYQDAESEHQKLLFGYTESHPLVIAAEKSRELARQRFLDAAARALLTGRSTLVVTRNQLANLRAKQDDLRNELASIEQRIVLAESGLGQLEAEYAVANEVHKGLQLNENTARIEAESNNEIVRVGSPAGEPSKPILPNPTIIFGIAFVVAAFLGLLFILVADNMEDTIVNLSDVEGRLSLKVLAVLPHVRRRRREQVARFLIDEKYSQFSEAVAGLRNLLDSPRYESMSHCMLVISTQPGEGKTITSTSLAIAYAQAGRRTIHVDFDLRRPRLAKIWELALTKETSFSHVLQSSGDVVPDFAKLVHAVSVPKLDVIASLPPDGVAPSQIFGSFVVGEFFKWARQRYERIVIDSPPYGLVGDVVSLAMQVDSVVVMCCPDRTHFRPIQYCTRCLTEAGANILGVIVNDVEISNAAAFSPSSRHSYHKYGYGYGDDYGYTGSYGAETSSEGEGKLQGKEFNDEE